MISYIAHEFQWRVCQEYNLWKTGILAIWHIYVQINRLKHTYVHKKSICQIQLKLNLILEYKDKSNT